MEYYQVNGGGQRLLDMKSRLSKVISVQIVLVILLFLSACTHIYTFTKDFEMPAIETKKIPLRVGLYLQADFCQFVFKKDYKFGDKYVFQIGEALCSSTEKMLKLIFSEVVNLESPEVNKSHGINALVIPQIVSVGYMQPAWRLLQDDEVIIKVKYTFFNTNKKIIWVDTFQGIARGKDRLKCMQFAVEEQFRRALEGILSSKCWEKN